MRGKLSMLATKQIRLPPFWEAVGTALVLQGITYLLTGLVLDGGQINGLATLAILLYWAGFLAVLLMRAVTRRLAFSRRDAVLVKSGYLLLLMAIPLFAFLVGRLIGLQ